MPSSIDLAIKPKQYVVQKLKVNPGMVELSPADLDRVKRERPVLEAAFATFSATLPSSLRLRQPVPGERSSSDGARRVFNGEPRSPHSGMDIAALRRARPSSRPRAEESCSPTTISSAGTPWSSTTGRGSSTMYGHLSAIDVAAGEVGGRGRRHRKGRRHRPRHRPAFALGRDAQSGDGRSRVVHVGCREQARQSEVGAVGPNHQVIDRIIRALVSPE